MSPIKGLTETKRLPRLGKIHLGVKVKNDKGIEYPKATDYFVCPPEVSKVYGEKPKELDIIIPVEDDEIWASQYYRQYSRTRGLVCKGDGETCRRMIDAANGDIANRDSKLIAWKEMACAGRDCPDYQGKKCQEVMNLQFMLPKVPGLGIWQIDTGSINGIRNINNCATMIRAVCGRVSWIPLSLTLEATEVVNPDDGKKKKVHCVMLRTKGDLLHLLSVSEKPRAQLMITAPADDEAPMDESVTEPIKEDLAQAEKDAKELFGDASQSQIKAGGDKVGSNPADATVDWLMENLLKAFKNNERTILSWLASKGVKGEKTLEQTLAGTSKEKREELIVEVQDRISML